MSIVKGARNPEAAKAFYDWALTPEAQELGAKNNQFQLPSSTAATKGAKITVVSPCEGTGYEVGSMSIVKGARNPEAAKAFYDWALTPEAQELGAINNQFQLPSNSATPVPPEAPDLAKLKLIAYDFDKYGSPAERNRLLARWTKDVKNAQ